MAKGDKLGSAWETSKRNTILDKLKGKDKDGKKK